MKLTATSEPRADGRLSLVEATESYVVLSDGEQMAVKYSKLAELCRQLVNEQAAVRITRTWLRGDEWELVEIHRVGSPDWAPIQPGTRDAAF